MGCCNHGHPVLAPAIGELQSKLGTHRRWCCNLAAEDGECWEQARAAARAPAKSSGVGGRNTWDAEEESS